MKRIDNNGDEVQCACVTCNAEAIGADFEGLKCAFHMKRARGRIYG